MKPDRLWLFRLLDISKCIINVYKNSIEMLRFTNRY